MGDGGRGGKMKELSSIKQHEGQVQSIGRREEEAGVKQENGHQTNNSHPWSNYLALFLNT